MSAPRDQGRSGSTPPLALVALHLVTSQVVSSHFLPLVLKPRPSLLPCCFHLFFFIYLKAGRLSVYFSSEASFIFLFSSRLISFLSVFHHTPSSVSHLIVFPFLFVQLLSALISFPALSVTLHALPSAHFSFHSPLFFPPPSLSLSLLLSSARARLTPGQLACISPLLLAQ